MPSQKSHALSKPNKSQRQGFAFAEKWIIWSVLCLLLALSTHWLIFPALQLLAWGLVRWRWQAQQRLAFVQRWPAIIAFISGGILLYYAVLALWA